GILDLVGDLLHRAEQRVHRDQTDGRVFRTVAVGGDIALAGGDGELHAEIHLLVQGAEHQVGIEDLDIGGGLDVAGLDLARALLAQGYALGTFGMHAQRDHLHVEHDVGDVFAHALDGGEFVQHALDRDGGDGRALQG